MVHHVGRVKMVHGLPVYRRSSNYRCPDRFGVYIYNQIERWGYRKLIENFIAEFDSSLKKSCDDALKCSWATISGLAR